MTENLKLALAGLECIQLLAEQNSVQYEEYPADETTMAL